MSISFILFGLIFILFLFGVLKCKNFTISIINIFALLFVLLGYFFGTIESSFVSFNLFHILSGVLFIFIYFDKIVLKKLHIIVLLLVVDLIAVTISVNCLSVFSLSLFLVLSSILFLFFYDNCNLFVSSFIFFSYGYFLIDSIYQYSKMGFALMNFDAVFFTAVMLFGLCKLYSTLFSRRIGHSEYFCFEK